MIAAGGDLFLFLKATDGLLRGIMGIYVNDKIGTGDENFYEESKFT